MAEYIDREKIIKKTCSDCTRQFELICRHPEPCGILISAFLCEQKEDVAVAKHGKANYIAYDMPYCEYGTCSVCGAYIQAWNYCPNCGAKMDLDE